MPNDIKDLSLDFGKAAVDLAEVDLWLRGRAFDIVPFFAADRDRKNASALSGDSLADVRLHALIFSPDSGISQKDIERMTGYKVLLDMCRHEDFKVDIVQDEPGLITVEFDPDKRFDQSVIFGASYSNVIPLSAGVKKIVL